MYASIFPVPLWSGTFFKDPTMDPEMDPEMDPGFVWFGLFDHQLLLQRILFPSPRFSIIINTLVYHNIIDIS